MILTRSRPIPQIPRQMALAHLRAIQWALTHLKPLQYLTEFPTKIHYHILRKSIPFPLHLRWCYNKFNLPTHFHRNQLSKRMTSLVSSRFTFGGH